MSAVAFAHTHSYAARMSVSVLMHPVHAPALLQRAARKAFRRGVR
jgi:hypothetical protein